MIFHRVVVALRKGGSPCGAQAVSSGASAPEWQRTRLRILPSSDGRVSRKAFFACLRAARKALWVRLSVNVASSAAMAALVAAMRGGPFAGTPLSTPSRPR